MLITRNFLSDLTGLDRRTITKRLGNIPPVSDDAESRYDSRTALEAIYSLDALNAVQEKAKLDRVRRELAELQKAERLQQLIPSEVVEKEWTGILLNVRARLLQVPTRVAAEVPSDVAATVESRVRDFIYEALLDLSKGKPE